MYRAAAAPTTLGAGERLLGSARAGRLRSMVKWLGFMGMLGACALFVCGCGSDGTPEGQEPGANGGTSGVATAEPTNGQVTAEWDGYCTATFMSDHSVDTGVGGELFRARAGDRYLVSGGGSLLYLTPDGPYPFHADPAVVTSTCSDPVAYAAAFVDVTFYTSEDRMTPLCELSAGTAALLDPALSLGGNPQGQADAESGVVYELSLNSLGQHCDGAKTGFVYRPWSAPEGLNINTYLLPLEAVFK